MSELLTAKYGKPYAESCRTESVHISEKLKHKLSIQAPPKLLIENYMIEIAKNYNLDYEPDPQVMKSAEGKFIVNFYLFRNIFNLFINCN